MIKKILIDEKTQKSYAIRDISKRFQTRFGYIESSFLEKPSGSIVKNNRENETFVVLEPDFIDAFQNIKRKAQIMSLKELGAVLAYTGAGKDSLVVEAGSGSGASACFLAMHTKRVYSYDVDENNILVAKGNASDLGIDNIEFSQCDVCEKIPFSGADIILLDLPRPWDAVNAAYDSLRIGGFLVSYSPCITQTQEFVNKVLENPGFIAVKNIDILERDWEVLGKKVRPVSGPISHTGFLSFARKIK